MRNLARLILTLCLLAGVTGCSDHVETDSGNAQARPSARSTAAPDDRHPPARSTSQDAKTAADENTGAGESPIKTVDLGPIEEREPEPDPKAEFHELLAKHVQSDAALGMRANNDKLNEYAAGYKERIPEAWRTFREAYETALEKRAESNAEDYPKVHPIPAIPDFSDEQLLKGAQVADNGEPLSLFSMAVALHADSWEKTCKLAGELLGIYAADAHMFQAGRLWRVLQGIEEP